MQQRVAFSVTADLAADVGIHLGDGSLSARMRGSHSTYQYDITGHATEDQLYLIGQVIPIVSSAYGLHQPGIYLDRRQSWISVRYQSKSVVLFKHESLGLPNGRKTNASIPHVIRDDGRLMRCLARELVATDGVLGFYSASPSGPHKYARIQLKLTAAAVVAELANFLKHELGMSVSCRMNAVTHGRWIRSPQHILQVNCLGDIDTWRREIGFSNPSHISRLMIFELMGECPPRTGTVGRLSFLSGRSSDLTCPGPIPRSAFISVIDEMRKRFGSPRVKGEHLIQQMRGINRRLQTRLGRGLPEIVNLRAAGEI